MTRDLKALWDELFREALARAGVTCGSLCGPTAPLEVAVIDPIYHLAEWIPRGAESRLIKPPRRSFDEPELVAFLALEDRRAEVVHRLTWPPVERTGRREPVDLVARAVAKANRMALVSISRAPFGGHLVKLRHSLSGPTPLPPVMMLTILVEGDDAMVLPPLPNPTPPKAQPSDAEVAEWFRQRGEHFLARTGRKPVQEYMFVECRNATGATEPQMRRVWAASVPPHLRRGRGERA